MPSRRRPIDPVSSPVTRRPRVLVVGALALLVASGCGIDATGVEPFMDASSTTGVDAVDGTGDASTDDDAGTPDPARNACGGTGALDGTPGTACATPGSIWICRDERVVCAAAPAPLDVRASSDRAEDVLVEWSPPVGAAPSSYDVRRDGQPLASVGPDARHRRDRLARARPVSALKRAPPRRQARAGVPLTPLAFPASRGARPPR